MISIFQKKSPIYCKLWVWVIFTKSLVLVEGNSAVATEGKKPVSSQKLNFQFPFWKMFWTFCKFFSSMFPRTSMSIITIKKYFDVSNWLVNFFFGVYFPKVEPNCYFEKRVEFFNFFYDFLLWSNKFLILTCTHPTFFHASEYKNVFGKNSHNCFLFLLDQDFLHDFFQSKLE